MLFTATREYIEGSAYLNLPVRLATRWPYLCLPQWPGSAVITAMVLVICPDKSTAVNNSIVANPCHCNRWLQTLYGFKTEQPSTAGVIRIFFFFPAISVSLWSSPCPCQLDPGLTRPYTRENLITVTLTIHEKYKIGRTMSRTTQVAS